MAQPQNNVSLTAPGFSGLNTQDSPLDMDPSYASIANNCVIDKFGRIASRRGLQYMTTNPSILGGNPIEALHEFVSDTGATTVFACGNEAIYIQNTGPDLTLVPVVLPVDYVITENNWKMVTFNDRCYFVQAGHRPLVFDPAVPGELAYWLEEPLTNDYPNEAHAAFGRLWLTDFDNSPQIVFWSGLLDGQNWSSFGTGSLNTNEYWPSGFDECIALAAHNNFMCVFGQNNILLYQTTPDVNNSINLVDTIEGLGCIARDSLAPTGTDFMFIDSTGVRSLNRTIQEKSVPIGDISRNVRQEFQEALQLEPTDNVSGFYHVEDSFYVCFLPNNPDTYVFDTWAPLPPEGAARCTKWIDIFVRCGVRLQNRTSLFGGTGGVYYYRSSIDVTADDSGAEVEPIFTPIEMEYWTHPMDFGSPSNLIFPKQVDVTIFGGLLGNLTLNWAYDYRVANVNDTLTRPIVLRGSPSLWYTFGEDPTGTPLPPDTVAYYPMPDYDNPPVGVAEFEDPEPIPPDVPPPDGNPLSQSGYTGYWTSGEALNEIRYNIWGSGRNIKIGFRTKIAGDTVSFQEINIQALQGRIL